MCKFMISDHGDGKLPMLVTLSILSLQTQKKTVSVSDPLLSIKISIVFPISVFFNKCPPISNHTVCMISLYYLFLTISSSKVAVI